MFGVQPKISIITPSFNQGDFIGHTIDSVLNQSYPDLEYIVVDGGSTDCTLEVLNRYSGRISWISEKDGGQSNAINKGLRLANGEVIAYLNSDDIYLPDSLSAVGEFFASHPEAAWLTGKCRLIDQHGSEIRKAIMLYKNFWLQLSSYRVLLTLDYISQPATFWRRRVINEIGYFDENLKYAMDYDYSLRVGRKYKLWVLNKYLAAFRIHSSSKTGSSARVQFREDLHVSRRYTSSNLINSLHTIHNALIILIYRLLIQNSRRTQILQTGYNEQ
jgi:glycosyltransferase involved in cell wall biosynthesis